MIPTEKELLEFIEKKKLATFSDIARQFEIKNATVSDYVAHLKKKRLIKVERIGTAKVVSLKK